MNLYEIYESSLNDDTIQEMILIDTLKPYAAYDMPNRHMAIAAIAISLYRSLELYGKYGLIYKIFLIRRSKNLVLIS